MPRTKKENTKSFQFDGFSPPESNYFKMPNQGTDITAQIDNLAELKVVEYVLRHTWGFQEFGISKHITNDEFVGGRRRKDGSRLDRGTGLSLRGVRDGINKAVEHGLLEEQIDDSDRGRVRKFYCLRMRHPDQIENSEPEDLEKLGGQTLPPQRQSLPTRQANFAHRTEKDTLERHSEERHFNISNSFELQTQVFKTTSDFKKSKQRDEIVQTDAESTAGDQPSPIRKREMKPISELLEERRPALTPTPDAQEASQPRRRGRPPKYPATAAIEAMLTQWTDELRDDPEHARSNVSQAARLWHESGVSEDTFRDLLYEARRRTKQAGNVEKPAEGDAGKMGLRNRMPYFFACLKTIIRDDLQRQVEDKAPITGKGTSSRTKAARTTDVRVGTFRPPRAGS